MVFRRRRFAKKRRVVYRRRRFVRTRRTYAFKRSARRRMGSDFRRPYSRDHQLLKVTTESEFDSQSDQGSIYLPATTHAAVSVTTNVINEQLQNALADRWQQYKIVKAVTRFRLLGVKGNSNYVPAEQYSGSFVYPDHQQLSPGAAQLSEILQLPYGRKHGMYYGTRVWYPKLLQYVATVGAPTDTQSKFTFGGFVSTASAGDVGNIEWGGLGLILPGVHTTPVPYATSDDTYFIPKWTVETTYYVKLRAMKNYYND